MKLTEIGKAITEQYAGKAVALETVIRAIQRMQCDTEYEIDVIYNPVDEIASGAEDEIREADLTDRYLEQEVTVVAVNTNIVNRDFTVEPCDDMLFIIVRV